MYDPDDTTLEDELTESLEDAGYAIAKVRSLPVSPDGIEQRGVFRELGELVQNVMVFSSDEIDADSARVLLDIAFSWLRARRERGMKDDIGFVSIYGPDNRSVLVMVPVPRHRDP